MELGKQPSLNENDIGSVIIFLFYLQSNMSKNILKFIIFNIFPLLFAN